MGMLATAVSNLHQVEKIVPAVQDLGRRHVGYGVTADQYEPVGEALLWTLEKGLGPAFTPQVNEAWTSAYTTLASVMTSRRQQRQRHFRRRRARESWPACSAERSAR